MKRSDSWFRFAALALAIGCGGDDNVNASLSGSDSDSAGTDSAGTDTTGTASMTDGTMSASQTGSATDSGNESGSGTSGDTDSMSNSQTGTGDTEGQTESASDTESNETGTGTTGGIEPPEIPTDPPGEETGPCEPGELRACYTGNPTTYLVGLCQPGIQECVAVDLDYGEWGPCEDEHLPTAEVCDGFDNDCDASVDEDQGTMNCGLGLCNHDEPNCVDGLPNTCDPDQGAMFETCDGIDNDCDGDIDEGLGEEVVECGVGQCEHTETACEGTIPECDPLEGATTEQCDGIDNDCDGDVDEGIDDITCGVGECLHTIPGCIGGVPQMCNPFEGQSVEICDGLDNDCDGLTDEDQGVWQCGDFECTVTVPQCVDGVPQPQSSCVPEPGGAEICGNGVDDNCDGEDPPCAENYLVGTDTTSRPIDVIWLVDSSGSMDAEMDTVEAEINDFATALDNAGGNNALHLIADRGQNDFEICVQPPLGNMALQCADNPIRFYQYDTNGPGESMIHSSNALGRAIQQHGTWGPRLQANSHIAFIVTTDDDGDDPGWTSPNDDSEEDDCGGTGTIGNGTTGNVCRYNDGVNNYTSLADDFGTRLGFISFMENYYPNHVPGDDWTFYSIIGDTGTTVLSGADNVYEFSCNEAAETGDEYVKLSLYTGVQDQMINICDADWDLTGLADAIASNVPSDTYVLDGTPAGNCLGINPATINVVVNGVPMNGADWSYDAPSCTVTINNNVPTVGDNVVIVYENF